jgi:hypothetical protein
MNHADRHRLLDEVLQPASLAGSLAAVRRAARRRRVRRRVTGLAAITAAAFAAAQLYSWLLAPGPDNTPRPAAIAQSPPFVLVTNRRTSPPPAVIVRSGAAPPGLVVTTPPNSAALPRASHDDVFASAGRRPGGIHRRPDGTSRWIWLDPIGAELP